MTVLKSIVFVEYSIAYVIKIYLLLNKIVLFWVNWYTVQIRFKYPAKKGPTAEYGQSLDTSTLKG